MNEAVQSSNPPAADLIDRIANALPAEQRADYYREMRHCRSLPENDEMLRILRSMMFLTQLMVEVPNRVVVERQRLEALFTTTTDAVQSATESSLAWQKQLDEGLRHLPEDIARGIRPEAIVAKINESLRQQFVQSTIPQTAQALTVIGADMRKTTDDFRQAADGLGQSYGGAAEQARKSIRQIELTVSRAADSARQSGSGTVARVPAGVSMVALYAVRSGLVDRPCPGSVVSAERLLQARSVHPALHNRVLIVDEAGMVSGRQMSELLQLAETHSVRVIFSGDTNQIQSVEAGDALRVLEKESRLKSIALTEVQRQKRKDYRAAIQELRSNPERGFEKLDAMGAVHEIGWQDRAQTVAQAYVESDRAGRNVLVVCPTHGEIDRVTDAIRFVRKHAGALGESVRVDRDVSLNWTTAQKSDLRNFRSGQIIRFHRSVHGIAKNGSAVVVRVEDKKIIIHTDQGKTRSISARDAKAFDVFERRAFEVAPSDKLLLTANHREPRFRATNGEIVTVSQIDGQGRIHLQDGRILPPNYKQFAHGYAVTAHRSQGKSVDSVIISVDGMQKELFYVAASRGREQLLVITSDKEHLRESVAQSTARLSATELARRARPGLHQGLYRGRAAARDLVLRAAQCAAVQERQTVAMPLTPSSKVERNHDQSLSR